MGACGSSSSNAIQPDDAAPGEQSKVANAPGNGSSPVPQLQELRALSSLDDSLVDAFRRLDIRLLRSSWLLQQPPGFRLPRRQDLEAREREEESPLLSGEEAVKLVHMCGRGMGSLTYGWLTPGDPDPEGERVKVVIRALRDNPHIVGLFWDYASLYQQTADGKVKRTVEEDAQFKEALKVMADVYASAVGTTVLQVKEIPPRPARFDGAICLFGLEAGVSEAAVREALGQWGQIVGCELDRDPAVVRFSTHDAALKAKGKFSEGVRGLFGGVEMQYNERSYNGCTGEHERANDNGRGWCCFENAVSSELLARLSAYPKMKALLDKLPPKLLLLSSEKPAEPVKLQSGDLASRVQEVVTEIEASTFTGKGDKETVPNLYKGYVEGITGVLQRTLAFAGFIGAAFSSVAPSLPPLLPVLSASYSEGSTHLAVGQLLLALPDAEARRSGSEGFTHLVVVSVNSDDTRFQKAIGNGSMELAYDDFSQVVLPWRPPNPPSAAEGQARMMRSVAHVLREVRTIYEAVCAECAGASKRVAATAVRKAAEATVQQLAAVSYDTSALRKAVRQASHIMQLEVAIGERALESLGADILRATGSAGMRFYSAGQLLSVRLDGHGWVDAEVVDNATVRATDSGEERTLWLHPWNHAPIQLPSSAFEEVRNWYVETLRAQHAHVLDALSGCRLDVLEQCIAIGVSGDSAVEHITDASSLTAWLHELHGQLCAGGATETPAAVLLTGRPASGKTSLLSQVVIYSVGRDYGELVPILIKVQLLQTRLLEDPTTFAAAWNWVDGYLQLEHAAIPQLYRMLRQAMMARRALLLLDGLDEGGARTAEIERHVQEVLAPQGHTVFATSRPTDTPFDGFHRLHLSPLSAAQQEQAIELRLGAERAAELLPFLRDKVPLDEAGERITGNPLMLSMVISIFELRRGLQMPETVVELYEVATEAMLLRAGSTDAMLRPLLQAVFFEAHVNRQRVITVKHLEVAAQKLAGSGGALRLLTELVMRDSMPLLSLLQASPLRVQAAHLSFQEFFAARAICDGRREHGTQLRVLPWQLPVWWLNAVRLGVQMGNAFGRGMLEAAGDFAGGLDSATGRSVRVPRIGGDSQTSALAVGAALFAATHVGEARVGRATLPLKRLREGATEVALTDTGDQELVVFASFLRAGPRSGRLTLSLERSTRFGRDGATALACIPSLTRLDLSGTKMDDAQMRAVGHALLACTGSSLGSLKCAAFDLRAGASGECDLNGNKLSGAAAVLLAGALKFNASLETLGLADSGIGDAGAAAIADAIRVNASLKALSLFDNSIGDEGAAAIADALRVNASLTYLDLEENKIGDEGSVAIGKALQVNAALTKLNLDGFELSITQLKGIEPVKHLHLSFDGLGTASAIVIAKCLEVNASLKELYLHGNNFGPSGAMAIAEALKVNASLTELELSSNAITNEGAKALASALEVNASLKSLDLRFNQIGEAGAAAIADALRVNVSMTFLDLEHNNIGEASKAKLREVAAGARNSLRIDLEFPLARRCPASKGPVSAWARPRSRLPTSG